jgi:hypothetical protein
MRQETAVGEDVVYYSPTSLAVYDLAVVKIHRAPNVISRPRDCQIQGAEGGKVSFAQHCAEYPWGTSGDKFRLARLGEKVEPRVDVDVEVMKPRKAGKRAPIA